MTLREHDEIVRIGDMLIEKVTKALREAAIIKNSKCKNFVKNMFWSDAGLSLNTDHATIKDIATGIINHDMVVRFLRDHCDEEDADEKYYNRNGDVNYYEVLGLAESALI